MAARKDSRSGSAELDDWLCVSGEEAADVPAILTEYAAAEAATFDAAGLLGPLAKRGKRSNRREVLRREPEHMLELHARVVVLPGFDQRAPEGHAG